MTEIEQRIAKIIAGQAQIDVADLTSESTMEEFQIPSIAQLEILFAIEEEFDIYFPDDDDSQADKNQTLRDLAITVQQMIDAKS